MGVAIARLAALFTGDNMIPLSEFPAIDATLNATSALLLTLGYFFIRREKIQAHKVCSIQDLWAGFEIPNCARRGIRTSHEMWASEVTCSRWRSGPRKP